MTMSLEQKVGFGALLGGGTTVLGSVLLRYFAEDKMSTPTAAGEEPTRPFMYEHAPLLGIIPGAVMTFVSYKWLGGAAPAVACAITSLFAGAAAPIDNWVVEARAEKDAKELAGGKETESGTGRRFAGFAQRLGGMRRVG